MNKRRGKLHTEMHRPTSEKPLVCDVYRLNDVEIGIVEVGT
jgi:hypothetical protein